MTRKAGDIPPSVTELRLARMFSSFSKNDYDMWLHWLSDILCIKSI